MSRRERREERLHAWADGELHGLAARWTARRVERSPEARRELEELRAVGAWVRDALAHEAAEPDLWPGIAARLAEQERVVEERRPRRWLLRPVLASAAVATAAVALVVGMLLRPQPAGGDVVQWLDSHGAPVMVLDGDDDTIIWMLTPGNDETSGSAARVAA